MLFLKFHNAFIHPFFTVHIDDLGVPWGWFWGGPCRYAYHGIQDVERLAESDLPSAFATVSSDAAWRPNSSTESIMLDRPFGVVLLKYDIYIIYIHLYIWFFQKKDILPDPCKIFHSYSKSSGHFKPSQDGEWCCPSTDWGSLDGREKCQLLPPADFSCPKKCLDFLVSFCQICISLGWFSALFTIESCSEKNLQDQGSFPSRSSQLCSCSYFYLLAGCECAS